MSLHEPFRFRYVREIVGVFVLGSLVIALVGLLAVGTGRRWFERRTDLGAVFLAEKAAVIHKGVPVRLAGERVGEVTGIRLEGIERSHVTMRVTTDSLEALRADSKAILRVPIAGLVGELAIELTPGTETSPFPRGAELPGIAQGDLFGELEDVASVLAVEVPAITKQVRLLLENANALAGQAVEGRAGTHAASLLANGSRLVGQLERERVAARAGALLAELDALLAAVNAGEGTAGHLVKDPALHDRIAALLADLHRSWADIAKILEGTGKVAGDAEVLTAQLKKRADSIPAMMDQTERLLLRTNQTLEGMQRHWLLRGSMEGPGPVPVPPAVLDAPAPAVEGGAR
ncbi:MAG TPA: MlaD family protein [Anaeromyxobacteraceae bacterium]|nr:MlaD family protein [Anaeromyxobacteraceae bacterium]